MAHIDLPEFEQMSPAIQERAKPILEKTGKLGEIFKLLAIDWFRGVKRQVCF